MTTPTTVLVQLKVRSDTAANWTSGNPTLLANELGRETDTGKIKIGTGSTAWTALPYQPFGALITNADISATAEIAVSKLADGAARQLLQTDAAGTGVEWTSNVDIPGTLDVTGTATFDGAVTVAGDLTVNGTTTTIDTQTLLVEDKNIEMGVVATPTDVTADGGGITLRGTTNKTINWINATGCWTSSENLDLAAGKSYFIDGAEVINGTSLGINVTDSSLTSVGTLGSLTVADFVFAGTFIPDGSTAPSNGLYLPAANTVAISTGGSGRLFVDASGRVGISSAASASTNTYLQVGLAGIGSDHVLYDYDSYFANNLYKSGSSTWSRISARTGGLLRINDDVLTYSTANSGTAGASATLSERLRITSAGLVGIGTSSPNSLFHVSGTAGTLASFERTGSNGVFIGLKDGSVNNVFLGNTNGVFSVQTPGSSFSDKLVITSAGLVGIGTTSPARPLDVNGSVRLSSGSVIEFGGTVTNFITGDNSSNYLAFGTNSSERARIDSSGRLLVGTSTARTNLFGGGTAPQLQVEGTSFAQTTFSIVRNENISTSVPGIVLGKTRGSSNGANTVVQSGDNLGLIDFQGADGTNLVAAARISADVDGTPGAADMPGRLVFSTTADGASSPTEQLRITSDRYVRLASGTNGIQFNGDTAAANALDDYEEGTWTPTVQFGGASVGIAGTFTGAYTKTGNVVTLAFRVQFSSKGTSTGAMTITGLPFSAGAVLDTISGFGYIHRLAALQTAGQLYLMPEGTIIYPKFAGYNSGNTTSLTDTDIADTTDLRGGIVYRV